jgi:hypothetical protein
MRIDPQAAVELWTSDRPTHLLQLARALDDATDLTGLVRDVVLEIIEANYRPALAWLAGAILDAGHRLDEALTWDTIRNEKIREWFEDHDDIGLLLLQGINNLSAVVEADVEALQDRTSEEVAADVALDLLGRRGKRRRLLRRMRRRASEPSLSETLPAVIQPRTGPEMEALLGQLEAANIRAAEAALRADEAEAALAAWEALEAPEAPSAEPTVEVVDEDEEDALAPPPVLSEELTSPPSPRAKIEAALASDRAEATSVARISSAAPQPTGRRRRRRGSR